MDRRISELFSLQELSYVLSQSIQLDRIADQVAKYAARFLQADGAIVVLAEGEAAPGGRRHRDRWSRCWERSAMIPTAWFAGPSARDRIEVAERGDDPDGPTARPA